MPSSCSRAAGRVWLLVRARRRRRRRRRHHDLAPPARASESCAPRCSARCRRRSSPRCSCSLWRPALVTQTLRPQENSVAVLLDTSGSMLYGDEDTSRLQQAVDSLTRQRAAGAREPRSPSICSRSPATLIELPSLEQVPPPGPVTHIGDALLNVLRGAQSGADRGRRARDRRRRQLRRLRRGEDRRDRELRRAGPHRRRRRRDDAERSRARGRAAAERRLAGLDGQRAGQHPPQRRDARAAQGLRRRRDPRVRGHPAAGDDGRHDALGRHRRRRGRRARPEVRARRAARRDQRHQQLAPAADGSARAAATHLIYRGRAALGVQVHPPRHRRGSGGARREPAQDHAEQVLPPGRRVARRARPTVSRPRSSSCSATTR